MPWHSKQKLKIEIMETTELKQQVIDTLHTIFDPEIPVNIYELGLI